MARITSGCHNRGRAWGRLAAGLKEGVELVSRLPKRTVSRIQGRAGKILRLSVSLYRLLLPRLLTIILGVIMAALLLLWLWR